MLLDHFRHGFEIALPMGGDGIQVFTAEPRATFLEVVPQGAQSQEENPLFSLGDSDTARYLQGKNIRFVSRMDDIELGRVHYPDSMGSNLAAAGEPDKKLIARLEISHSDALRLYDALCSDGKLTEAQRDLLQANTREVMHAARVRRQPPPDANGLVSAPQPRAR